MDERVLTAEEIAQGYITTEFGAYTNYECVHQYHDIKNHETAPVRCAYSTLWIGKMEDHITKGNHPWGRPDGPFIPRPESVAVKSTEPLSEY